MKFLSRCKRAMAAGWVSYLALVIAVLYAHSCALEQDEAAARVTGKAAIGRSV